MADARTMLRRMWRVPVWRLPLGTRKRGRRAGNAPVDRLNDRLLRDIGLVRGAGRFGEGYRPR